MIPPPKPKSNPQPADVIDLTRDAMGNLETRYITPVRKDIGPPERRSTPERNQAAAQAAAQVAAAIRAAQKEKGDTKKSINSSKSDSLMNPTRTQTVIGSNGRNIGSSGKTSTGSGGKNTGSLKPDKPTSTGTGNQPAKPWGPAYRPDTSPKSETPATSSSTTTSDVSSSAAAAIPRQSLIPGRDVINFQTTPTSPEAMQQILFEEIAGYELVNMARRDTVEGQSDVYTVISNLSSIRREYNPSQIISLQKPNFTGFETYQVDLNNYVPNDIYLQEKNISSFYYIASNGDLVIELDNLQNDDEIEVQVANNGKIT